MFFSDFALYQETICSPVMWVAFIFKWVDKRKEILSWAEKHKCIFLKTILIIENWQTKKKWRMITYKSAISYLSMRLLKQVNFSLCNRLFVFHSIQSISHVDLFLSIFGLYSISKVIRENYSFNYWKKKQNKTKLICYNSNSLKIVRIFCHFDIVWDII